MSDDLVKRLRDGGFLMVDDRSSIREYYVESEKLKGEAADHIEKLEAALQAVIRYAGNAGDDYLADKARKALGDEPISDSEARIIINKARKALEGNDET